MLPEIHGLEVAEQPGEEDLSPLKIPAWLSLDLHGRSERSTMVRTYLIRPHAKSNVSCRIQKPTTYICIRHEKWLNVWDDENWDCISYTEEILASFSHPHIHILRCILCFILDLNLFVSHLAYSSLLNLSVSHLAYDKFMPWIVERI